MVTPSPSTGDPNRLWPAAAIHLRQLRSHRNDRGVLSWEDSPLASSRHTMLYFIFQEVHFVCMRSPINPRVSIAMATYNGGRYLEAQLRSFLHQTILPNELIISDDCSTDNTLEIVQRFAKTAPFQVKILVNDQNLGYVVNFSKALEYCSGDLVFLSDQDDVWHDNKIERIIRIFESAPNTVLLIHDLDICNEDLTTRGETKIEFLADDWDIERHYVTGMASAIRQRFLKLCLPVPVCRQVTHDLWLSDCARLIEGKKITRDVLAKYRRHNQSVTGLLSKFPKPLKNDHLLHRLKSTFSNIRQRPSVQVKARSPQLNWLIATRDALVDGKFTAASTIDKTIREHLSELDFNNKRVALFNYNRFKRVPHVLKLYFSGGYHFSNGFKSAIRDLFAP